MAWRTKKEIVGEFIVDLLNKIGIEPVTGLCIIAFLLVLYRFIDLYKQKREGEKRKPIDVFYDIVFVICFLIYLFFYINSFRLRS